MMDNPSKRIAPLLDSEAAKKQVEHWQGEGLKVGFTNGCFDILHFGHVHYLDQARDLCDRLIVALNHDASVKILKGPTRPVHDETSRATVLGALASVDMVVFFGAKEAGEDNTPCALVEQLQPNLYVKGGDYKVKDLPETKIVHGYGGEVKVMSLFAGHSTTNSIQKMQS